MSEHLITVRGVVRALDGSDALVTVEQGGCGRCHEEGGCGGHQLTQMFCSGPKSYKAQNAVGAAIGDHVLVATAPGSIRQTANIAYVVPLLGAIGGALAGNMFRGDAGAVIGAIAGLFIAFGYVRYVAQKASGTAAVRPYIISRS